MYQAKFLLIFRLNTNAPLAYRLKIIFEINNNRNLKVFCIFWCVSHESWWWASESPALAKNLSFNHLSSIYQLFTTGKTNPNALKCFLLLELSKILIIRSINLKQGKSTQKPETCAISWNCRKFARGWAVGGIPALVSRKFVPGRAIPWSLRSTESLFVSPTLTHFSCTPLFPLTDN